MHLLTEKELDAINLWKSDTLQAYTSRQGYEDQRHKVCKLIRKASCGFLDKFKFVKSLDWMRKYGRFMEQVAKPAAELAVEMSCSPEQYRWEWYNDSEWYSKGVVSKRDMNNFTMLDVLTHQSIRMAKFNGVQTMQR